MARIPDAFIDDLLARTDVVELIGSRIPLKRQGREYSARCPFHDERSPSFTVSPNKQFYHCFGCGAHGTAIAFLMNYDRLEFMDAVEELAKRAGMEIPKDTRARNESGESKDLYAALDAATQFFQKQLAQNASVQSYLDTRGVDIENRARFSIGYAPEGFNALKDALGTDDRRMKLLEKVGLFSKNDSGRIYDKFRDRVMFPIHDRRGRVIAFGGRVLKKDDGPKYLNSPETPLFHKGRELYGLWQVKQANAKIARLVVVEGYMDVVALFQYGVTQAVATLGTATTPEHAELLFRNAADVYFCFDGDRAGRGAAWKAVESVLPRMKDGRQAYFLFLPDGEDPDSIVRQEGAEGFDTRLRQAMPLSEFFFDQISKDVDDESPDGKARLGERAKVFIERIPDGEFKDRIKEILVLKTTSSLGKTANFAHDLAARFDMEVRSISRGEVPDGYLTKVSTSGVSFKKGAATHSAPAPKRSLVRTAIALLLQQPSLALHIEPPHLFAILKQPGIPLLCELIALIRERPEINTGLIIERYAEREEQASLQKLAAQEFPGNPEHWQTEFNDALQQLNKQTRMQRIEELNAKSGRTATESNELRELLASRLR
jgi:DNA primase